MNRSNPFVLALAAGLFVSNPGALLPAQADNGLAPEVTDLNAADVSYVREKDLPYLEKPFISAAPRDRGDGLVVGELGKDGGDKDSILAFAREIARPAKNDRVGRTDSLLISHKGRLVFESYYRRGRANYPHYQMSITKAYTALCVGRAMQLGFLKMEDLDKPVVEFLKDLDRDKLASGADRITLNDAMTMRSGIRLADDKVKELLAKPGRLKGQGQIQAYLQHSAPIPDRPRPWKYQASDPSIAMQVLQAVIPGDAKTFIKEELLGRLGITTYAWQDDLSGLPKSAAGSSVRSRDMVKIGQMIQGGGKWGGEQLIPADFIARAVSPLAEARGGAYQYGFFFWVDTIEIDGKPYACKAGRGAGGQYLFMFPEQDLVAVITSHNKGMGRMLKEAPARLIRAFR